jgi:hypothetical protein
MDTLVDQRVIRVDSAGRFRPSIDVDSLLRPDNTAHATRRLRWLTNLLGDPRAAAPTAPPRSRAFPAAPRITDPSSLGPAAPAPPTARMPGYHR